jgi:hypothetical protein
VREPLIKLLTPHEARSSQYFDLLGSKLLMSPRSFHKEEKFRLRSFELLVYACSHGRVEPALKKRLHRRWLERVQSFQNSSGRSPADVEVRGNARFEVIAVRGVMQAGQVPGNEPRVVYDDRMSSIRIMTRNRAARSSRRRSAVPSEDGWMDGNTFA